MTGLSSGTGLSNSTGLSSTIGLWSGNVGLSGFSPLTLFALGEQGVWYDPSDLTSMYQDSAGTTAAAVGSPVGLMLDKRFGLVRGPELVTNGGFDDGLTGFTTENTDANNTIAVVGGKVELVSDGNNFCALRQNEVFIIGKTYQVTFDATNVTGGGFKAQDQTTNENIAAITSNGFYDVIFTATHSDFLIYRRTSGVPSTATIDNISVKEIPGNHATQSTTASKPILARNPVGGRRNLLTYSEDLSNAIWSKSGVTLSGVSQVSYPNGGALEVVRYTYSFLAGVQITISFTARSISGNTSLSTDLQNVDNNTVVLTEVEERFSWTVTPVANRSWLDFQLGGTGVVDISDIQVEESATATAYQRVVSQYDVSETGKGDCYSLAFDGVDDGMATAAIDFSASDEMSVFAGAKKGSATANQVLFETGNTNWSVGNGTIVVQLESGGLDLLSAAKGTAGASASLGGSSASGFDVGATAIFSSNHDISGDLSTLRINGVAATDGTADKGAGNFGNYPLYIGRRGGTTLPFNGNIYSIVIRGALTADATLTSAEAYVAGKTGVTI